jgi:hypothetical protein
MFLITSKPANDKLGIASFSAVLLAVDSNKTDPSHPWKHQLYAIIHALII